MKKNLKNPKKADLNKDGQLSGYEKKRGMAIEEAMNVKMGSMIMAANGELIPCLLYTSPSPRDGLLSRMPSSA